MDIIIKESFLCYLEALMHTEMNLEILKCLF